MHDNDDLKGLHPCETSFRLLLVGGDEQRVSLIRAGLRAAGFEVDAAADVASALALVEKSTYDLALVDLKLPGAMDGLVFARWFRARWPATGIVMHSVTGGTASRCHALEVCDDILPKPLDMTELIARLRSVARRSSRTPVSPVLTWGPFRVDLLRNRVWVDEREVRGLQPLQVRFLGYLIQNAGRVCTHEELRKVVFGAEATQGRRNIARVVSELRAELGEFGEQIASMRGRGYAVGLWALAHGREAARKEPDGNYRSPAGNSGSSSAASMASGTTRLPLPNGSGNFDRAPKEPRRN